MTTSARYLESAKLEEVASQLQREGYEVTVQPSGPDRGYDLIATRPGKRIAVQVKADSQLRAEVDQIRELRRRAFEQGFDEFRLVVATPPHETAIKIEGLDRRLAAYVQANPPAEITAVSSAVAVKGVSAIDVDSIAAAAGSIRVAGSAMLTIAGPRNGGFDERIAPNWSSGFPAAGEDEADWTTWQDYWEENLALSFDVDLDPELEIARVHRFAIDTNPLVD